MGRNETLCASTNIVDAEDMFRCAATVFDIIGSPGTVIRNVRTHLSYSTMVVN